MASRGARSLAAIAPTRGRPTFADASRRRLHDSGPAEAVDARVGTSARTADGRGASTRSSTPGAGARLTGTLHPRVYRYDLDAHGQIFLSGTPHRNFVSNIARDVSFADTFLRRIVEREAVDAGDEYTHVSVCAGEQNLVRVAATPIVFQDLIDDGRQLSWAGSFAVPFEPARIRVSDQGYLFHPSCVVSRDLADNQTAASVEAPHA